jgi:hypothetical protein
MATMVSDRRVPEPKDQNRSQETKVKEIQSAGRERRQPDPTGELSEGLKSRGIEVNELWDRDGLWSREPSSETVERLIAWFSDESN